MLHIENIKSLLETKATAKLPIGQKEMNKILAQFKGDWNEALTVLWVSLGATMTTKIVNQITNDRNITFATRQNITDIFKNWREDVLKPLYGDITATTGKQTAGAITNTIGSLMKFDIATPPIANFINTETLSLAVDLESTMFTNLHATIRDSVINDWSQVTTRNFLKQNMTLTNKEMKFVKKRYLQIIESETKLGIEKMGLSPAKARARAVKKAVVESNKIFRRTQNRRIERIRRTETARIKGFSDQETLRQAELTGKINAATKTWIRTNSTDNWNSTIINQGRTIGYNEDFLRGDPTTASSLKYPSEINEHCYLEYNVKYKKAA